MSRCGTPREPPRLTAHIWKVMPFRGGDAGRVPPRCCRSRRSRNLLQLVLVPEETMPTMPHIAVSSRP
jgi:hypothetical protein